MSTFPKLTADILPKLNWSELEKRIKFAEEQLEQQKKALAALKKALKRKQSECPHPPNKTKKKTRYMGNDYWSTTETCSACGRIVYLPETLREIKLESKR